MGGQMIKGTLHAVVGHDLAGEAETSYIFESDGSQLVTLACDPPLGELIWATIEDRVLTEFVRIPGEAAPVERGSQRVALLRCVREDRMQDTPFVVNELSKAVTAAAIVQRFWRSKGWRFFDFECKAFILPIAKGEPMPDKSVWCTASIDRLAESSEEFRDFQANKFHLWGNRSLNYCGWGQCPGKYSMTFLDCGTRTMCHEIGHNLGAGHSNSESDGDVREYGNMSCVMGRGFGLSGAQSIRLNLNTDREIVTLNKSRRFLMAPIESNEDDLHDGMFQAARFARGSRNYVVAMNRDKRGYSVTVERYTKKPARLAVLQKAGSSFTVEDVTVTLDDMADGYAVVNVDISDGLGDQRIVLPDSLPPAIAPLAATTEHDGIWWNPLLDGQGFDLSGGDMGWYTFNPKKMRGEKVISQRWFSCVVYGLDCEIYTGNREEGVEVCGEGRLSFFDSDNGVFQYRVRDPIFAGGIRNGSVRIQRLTAGAGDVVYGDGSVRRATYRHGSHRITYMQEFCEPPLDHLLKPVAGNVNQSWSLLVDDALVKPVDGVFMEQSDVE